MKSKLSSKYFYGLMMIVVTVLWGAGSPISKIGYETFPPLMMLVIRFTIAFLIFFVVYKKGKSKPLNRNNIKGCILISVLTAVTYILAQMSLYFTAATIAGFLIGICVVFTPFFGFFIFRTKINPKIYPILIIVTLGMYLLCGVNSSYGFGIGEVMALLSSITSALWLVYAAKYAKDIGAIPLSMVQCGVTAIISLPFALIFESPDMLASVSTSGWLSLTYLTLFSTVITYFLQNTALGHISAVFASIVLSLEPVVTAVLSYFMLSEILSLTGYVGGTMIFAGIILASLIEEQATPEESSLNR